MQKTLQVILVILLFVLVFLIGFRAGSRYDIAVDENNDYLAISYSVNEQKMRRLMSLIDNHYVEDINTDSLVDKTITYVLSNLDPHSVYLDKNTSVIMDEGMKGVFVGIGMQYSIRNDTIWVTRLLKGSPNKDILQFDDKIIEINDSLVIGTSAETIDSLIKGEQNKTVNLTLLRGKDTLQIKAKRASIYQSNVEAAYMINKEIGYIKLTKFGEHAAAEFKLALNNLLHQGMTQLIFDLRGNPGGIMSAAQEIADEFLPNQKLIVYTQDKEGKKSYRYATKKGNFENKPVYVLINETSASASEIIAGALQDNDIGTIIGRRSYGKGLVQREISLGDGTKLRLTTAHYYTPTGRSIQKPYKHESNQKYVQDLSDRYNRGEMFSKDSIKVVDSLKFTTKKGKAVYGGGGIIPDEFIPIDTINYGRWFYEHGNIGLYYNEIYNHIQKNASTFKILQPQHFVDYYKVDKWGDSILVRNRFNPKIMKPKELSNFRTYLKATIGHIIYGREVYDQVWNRSDSAVLRAIYLAEPQEDELD